MSKYTLHKYGFNIYTGSKTDTLIQRVIKEVGEFEPDINTWIYNNVKPGWLVYDLGSHIGEISEMAALKGAKVLAFDVQKDICDSWIECRKRFNNNNDITIYNIGLSDKEEELTFYISDINLGGSSFSKELVYDIEPFFFLENGVPKNTKTMKLVRMDSLDLPDRIPDLVKIDVQEWEEKVWDGMPEHVKKATHVIAEVYMYTKESLINKYLDGRSAYSLDGTFITSDDPSVLLDFIKNNFGNTTKYMNVLFF